MANIKTYIKFRKGTEKTSGRIHGFVTKSEGSWRGCHDDEEKKKVVFVDTAITDKVIPGVLYSCSLEPMPNDNGFIAKSATEVKFEATISTKCRKGVFIVSVRFGNKVYVYDPASKDRHKTDSQAIANILRKRIDLKDSMAIAEEFINQAFMVKRLYQQYLENVQR